MFTIYLNKEIMKKIFKIILCLFLLTGCKASKNIEISTDDIESITFNYEEYEYVILEEKMDEVISIINGQAISKSKNIIENHLWSININKEDQLTIWLEQDGTILLEENNQYYEFASDSSEIYDLYLTVLSEHIFSGLLYPSSEWVKENDIHQVFHIKKELIQEIVFSSSKYDETFTLKEEKIDEFVDSLNSLEYYYCSEGMVMGGVPLFIVFQFNDYKFSIAIMNESDEINLIVVYLGIENNVATRELGFWIEKDSDFFKLFKEIVGENFFDEFKVVPSKEWLVENV